MLAAFLLVGVFLAVLLTAISSRTARERLVPFAIGVSAGLFAVQFANVHLCTIVVVAWFLAKAGRGEAHVSWAVLLLPVAAILPASTVVYGDLVVNRSLALQLLALALTGALVVAAADRRHVRTMLLGLLVTASAASALGLLQVAHLVPSDLWHIDISALGRPTGFYPEPDWLGMFAGIGVILAWREPLPPKLRIMLIIVNLSGVVLAFARAAWIGLLAVVAVGIAAWAFGARRPSPPMGTGKTGRLRATFLSAVLFTVAIIAIPSLRSDLTSRVLHTFSAQQGDVSAQARVEQTRGLVVLAKSAPWYGHGLSASGRVGVSGLFSSQNSVNSVGSNWVLSLWVDSAWLSIPLIAVLVGVAMWRLTSTAGNILLLTFVSSLFSNAFYQPIVWVAAAMILVELRSPRERRARGRGSRGGAVAARAPSRYARPRWTGSDEVPSRDEQAPHV